MTAQTPCESVDAPQGHDETTVGRSVPWLAGVDELDAALHQALVALRLEDVVLVGSGNSRRHEITVVTSAEREDRPPALAGTARCGATFRLEHEPEELARVHVTCHACLRLGLADTARAIATSDAGMEAALRGMLG